MIKESETREAGPPPGYDEPAPKWAARVVIIEGDRRLPWSAKVYDKSGSARSHVNHKDREYVEKWVADVLPWRPPRRVPEDGTTNP